MRKTFILFLLCCSFNLYAQNNLDSCELDGRYFANNILNNILKYVGPCKNNKANGKGVLHYNNGNSVTGLFIDNQIQDLYLDYYIATTDSSAIERRNAAGQLEYSSGLNTYGARSNKSYRIGPNKGYLLNGPCVEIDNNYRVSLVNMENGIKMGGDFSYFKLPPPTFALDEKLCDPLPVWPWGMYAQLIPNTTYIIYKSRREYNRAGYHKYWLSVIDLSTNKTVRTFGSFEKPLTLYDETSEDIYPLFIGFTEENDPIYNYSGKYHQLNINTGAIKTLSTLPAKVLSQIQFEEKKLHDSYKEMISFRKAQQLKDSSYIKIFNSKNFIDSFWIYGYRTPIKGIKSSLVVYNKQHQVIAFKDFHDIFLWDFAIDQFSNRIALSYRSKDSTYLSYFDLNTLEIISNIILKENTLFLRSDSTLFNPGLVRFSNTGKYLLYTRLRYNDGSAEMGTTMFLGEKIYYGFPDKLIFINKEDNIVITSKDELINAYDIEKKTIIWSFIAYDPIFFPLENYLYILSEEKKLIEERPGSVIGETKGIFLKKCIMPTPLLSLPEFVKNTDNLINITRNEIQNNQSNPIVSNNSTVKTSQACDLKITKPKLTYVFVDNRKLCYCCKNRYAPYKINSNENITFAKNQEEMKYLEALLYKHFEDTNADEEHKREDKVKVFVFKYKTYGASFTSIIADISSNILGIISVLFGSIDDTLTNKRREIDKYDILSKYCSRCEYGCN